jgi:alanine dehydrogenase
LRHFDLDATRRALPWPALIEALRAMFRDGCVMPVRHHHTFAVPGEPDATLLLMPAWQVGTYLGVKLASVVPGNASRGLPAVAGLYVLASARTGEILATMEGGELTARRTAAASALAADHLARAEASTLLMIGTGRLSLNLIQAHAAVRPIARVGIWGRNPAKAARVADEASRLGFAAAPVADLDAALAEADIVSAATLSLEPLVRGARLRPGAHVDLVGAFTPAMRESDDETMRRGRVFVDTRAGALKEAGDIVQAIAAGVLRPDDIAGDLAALVRGEAVGRTGPDEITVFKSVGAALEDLAAAILVHEGSH